LTGDLRSAFEIMLQNKEGVAKATIQVEKINGPVFLISGKSDEFWPSSEMSDLVIQRLKANNFPYLHEHLAIDGGHSAPLQHFDKIDQFLEQMSATTPATSIAKFRTSLFNPKILSEGAVTAQDSEITGDFRIEQYPRCIVN
jgi:hypothetical protein